MDHQPFKFYHSNCMTDNFIPLTFLLQTQHLTDHKEPEQAVRCEVKENTQLSGMIIGVGTEPLLSVLFTAVGSEVDQRKRGPVTYINSCPTSQIQILHQNTTWLAKRIKTLPYVPRHLLGKSGPNLPLYTNANHPKHEVVYVALRVTETFASTKYSC